MDTTNTKCETQGKDVSDICRLMVEEARESFYQRENFVRALDTKSFGVVSINAMLFAIFSYIITLFKMNFYISHIFSFLLL